MLDFLLSILILIGAGFTLIGSLGLVRLRDFYSRLHAPTKASTLGVGSLLIASALFFSFKDDGLSVHEVLVTLFLFITAPVGAHLMAKAALHGGERPLTADKAEGKVQEDASSKA